MASAWHQNISTSNEPVFAPPYLELDHLLLIVAILGQQLKGEIVLSSSPFRSSFSVPYRISDGNQECISAEHYGPDASVAGRPDVGLRRL